MRSRWTALLLLAACLAPLLAARSITPSTQGVGTHTQLGLPPCAFHATTGLPCATCGMTTSFAHATRGSLLDAFLTQPMGAGLAVLCMMGAIVAGTAAVTGASLTGLWAWLLRPRIVLILALLAAAAWAYKLAAVWTGGELS